MPEFIPEHTPASVDQFTRGYLSAAEWLLDEAVNRDKLRGFTREAIRQAVADCAEFQRVNAEALERYESESGRDMESAGIDFWLSRNGHGSGFFDRGDDPVFDQLQEAAKGCGECDSDVFRGWINLQTYSRAKL